MVELPKDYDYFMVDLDPQKQEKERQTKKKSTNSGFLLDSEHLKFYFSAMPMPTSSLQSRRAVLLKAEALGIKIFFFESMKDGQKFSKMLWKFFQDLLQKKNPWIQSNPFPDFFFGRPTQLFLWDFPDDKFPPWIQNGRRFVQIRELQGALRWGLGEFRGNIMVEIIVNAYSTYICIFYHISYISILPKKKGLRNVDDDLNMPFASNDCWKAGYRWKGVGFQHRVWLGES